MTLSPLANLPLTQAVYPELKRVCLSGLSHPRALEADLWMSRESPDKDKFLKYLGVANLKIERPRKNIQFRHLRSLVMRLWNKLSADYHTPRNAIRFDRIEWLYNKSNTEEKANYDLVLECIFGKNLQCCLSEQIGLAPDGLVGLNLKVTHGDDGPELKAYCEISKEWKPAELLPYRFQLVKITLGRSEDPDDPTPNYVTTLLAHSADLQQILPVAVDACIKNRDPQCRLYVEYYSCEILMAYRRRGRFGWVPPELDDDDSPAYWRPEYPFDPTQLLKDVMLLESEAGSSKTREAVITMDLGL